ncbi:hypothetical protein M758_4G181500 [Ceratodon purpureus]|nr:hypothetical protein M758_4G181500 [Ceratodon purpureus]
MIDSFKDHRNKKEHSEHQIFVTQTIVLHIGLDFLSLDIVDLCWITFISVNLLREDFFCLGERIRSMSSIVLGVICSCNLGLERVPPIYAYTIFSRWDYLGWKLARLLLLLKDNLL